MPKICKNCKNAQNLQKLTFWKREKRQIGPYVSPMMFTDTDRCQNARKQCGWVKMRPKNTKKGQKTRKMPYFSKTSVNFFKNCLKPLVYMYIVNMDFGRLSYYTLPRHASEFNHTKHGIYFKGIVQWHSLYSDNSCHYHVYSVLVLIIVYLQMSTLLLLVINV